ncbi:alpha/beta hydrolase fold protein [Aspergillus costaricaensis CBS 115574]|uniref:Alpha/beta hydrolase fold protein n=1 Tax=Aspergillus costaricaensis CBS 115574 TaxID=1448317 RepID=A0ACD1IK27_9EURO|nr:alpha/beta hydrolase fold protein [Aspergillus costaricaensis CBS 115574]RAK90756.1 alpha/beta hydrolase fold protein [Aspergillus costaricaensis CBS 115574]
MSPITRPPLHPSLSAIHQTIPTMDISTPEKRRVYRDYLTTNFTLENTLKGHESTIAYQEVDIPGPAGPLRATIFRPKHATLDVSSTPGILHLHGGGHSTGNRFMGFTVLDWVESLGAVIMTAEYRLAPEHPQPAQLEDSYAALKWMSDRAHDLGFNPAKLVVCGGSAGGNLAAGLSLLARDRAGPAIKGQVLMYPWVDDSVEWNSMEQFGDIAPLTKADAAQASDFAFGVNREFADMYTVPLRAKSFVGLPETFIDVGEADVFRDQDLAYAARLWRDGVATELHVWPGCWHGFDAFVPEAEVSLRAREARLGWLRRLLA